MVPGSDQTIPHSRASTIAAFWADSRDPLFPVTRFAMSGEIDHDVIQQVERDLNSLEESARLDTSVSRFIGASEEWSAQAQLRALRDYVNAQGPRPPVSGWDELEDDRSITFGDLTLTNLQRHGGTPQEHTDVDAAQRVTIYAAIGGAPAVHAVVERFYELVWNDPHLRPYFDGTRTGAPINMARLKGHQRAFITAAIEGPNEYTGRDMRTAHERLGISDDDFGRVVNHLVRALSEAGVPPDYIEAIGARVAPLRQDIVTSHISVYDAIGGAPAVHGIVDRFYERVMDDWQLRPHFDGSRTGRPINMARLKGHQRAFITAAIEGPNEYTGRDMRTAHERLRISDDDFGRVVTHLVTALSEAGVPARTIEAVGGKLAPLRSAIVTA